MKLLRALVIAIQLHNRPEWTTQFSGHWTNIHQQNLQSCGCGADYLLYCLTAEECVSVCMSE